MNDFPWLDHPAMKDIDAKKLSILVDFINEVDGLPIDKVIPKLMNTNKKMKDENLSFTKNENELITEILTKNMSVQDKQKFELIKSMMNKKK
ncbi:MAG TPA: hypothetical protein GXZ90_08895 [Clostridiales bacterium]|nr:hypothetical protein [Clostridiales bacterium]